MTAGQHAGEGGRAGRAARRARPARSRRGRTTLGALLALAVVSTAGAPSLITIAPGDTLWDLAKEHGTSVASLKALNDLPGNGTIYAGQQLRVASGGSTAKGSGKSTGGETRHRCPECAAPFPSAFAVECEECGAEVRPPEVLGVRIRKPGR